MSDVAWYRGGMVAFDLETTGVDPESDRIVTASVIEVGPTGVVVSRSWLVDPGVEIPAEAAAVHGVTTEKARDEGRPPAEALPEIGAAIDDAWARGLPLVIYNAPYDLTLYGRDARRHGLAGLKLIGPVVDPLVIDRALDPYRRGSRKLVDVCRHHGIVLAEAEAHTSVGDALAAARLAWKLAHIYSQCADLELLQKRQAYWHAAWADNFEGYLRRQGKQESVSRDWPIRA